MFVLGLPLILVGCLRQLPPPVTSYMLQSDIRPVRYEWAPAEQIAKVAREAVVASEDQKFWRHRGFDIEAMEKAYRQNQKRRQKRGASTISQQTAKNLFLWPGGGYLRKGIEAYLTVLIEWLWPKERILEVYLNIVEFGPGVYGVEAAAQHYFGKSANELTPGEAARLAAVLPSPKRWSVAEPGPYVMTRTAWILRQMGYAPRPDTVPDPEPEEPEADEPGGAVSPDPVESDEDFPEEDFEPIPGETPPESDTDVMEMPEAGATGDSGPVAPNDAEPQAAPRPQGGGSVIDETPGDDQKELEQSLIL
jgi:monofunctional biosynthetic peptidoglycan transglycosylase